MSSADRISRRIARYIYRDMDSTERIAFEADLYTDEELAEQFDMQSSAVDYLKSKVLLEEMKSSPDLEEAERIVDEFMAQERGEQNEEQHEERREVTTVPRTTSVSGWSKIRKVLLPIAAAAALIAGVILIRSFSDYNVGDRLFSQYYQPLDAVNFTPRSDNSNVDSRFLEAMNLYNNQNYSASSQLLSTVVGADPGFAEANLYLALSRLGSGQYAVAAGLLQDYLDQFTRYRPEAMWYLCMCYLGMDRLTEAGELAAELVDLEGAYGRNARTIQNRLRKIID